MVFEALPTNENLIRFMRKVFMVAIAFTSAIN